VTPIRARFGLAGVPSPEACPPGRSSGLHHRARKFAERGRAALGRSRTSGRTVSDTGHGRGAHADVIGTRPAPLAAEELHRAVACTAPADGWAGLACP
jgi:hypothetical protein